MTRPAIDLRSDTVTRPTPAMRRAMAAAEVGDDVFGEDPTVKRLRASGRPSCWARRPRCSCRRGRWPTRSPSGVHAGPGDELLCDATAHVYVWEGGGIARLWGVTTRTVERGPRPARRWTISTARSGPTTATTPGPGWSAWRTRTTAAAAGSTRSTTWPRSRPGRSGHGLAMHLDGARLMNAVVASGIPAAEWARALRHGLDLLLEGAGRPGRLGAGRPGRA